MSAPAMIYSLLGLAALAGLFYWAGGEGGKWYLNTKVRDFGVPFCAVFALKIFMPWHWTMVPTLLFLFGALTTYWTPKDQPDVKWRNWLATGAGYGAAFLPIAIATGHVWGWLIYTILLALTTCLWSEELSEVRHEAAGRGVLIIILLPVLFIL